MIVATSDDNNDEFSYFYCLFTAVGLSEGSSEAVLAHGLTRTTSNKRARDNDHGNITFLALVT